MAANHISQNSMSARLTPPSRNRNSENEAGTEKHVSLCLNIQIGSRIDIWAEKKNKQIEISSGNFSVRWALSSPNFRIHFLWNELSASLLIESSVCLTVILLFYYFFFRCFVSLFEVRSWCACCILLHDLTVCLGHWTLNRVHCVGVMRWLISKSMSLSCQLKFDYSSIVWFASDDNHF